MSESAGARLLSKLDGRLAVVEDALSMLAAYFILGLMILGTINVIGRKMGAPVWGYVDIVTLSMVTFSFLPISAMQRIGGHIRMELIVRQMSGRTLWVTEFFGVLVAVFIMTVLVYFSFTAFVRAFELGDSTIDREIATWPSKIWVPIAFSVLLARLVLQAIGYSRLIIDPKATPIAVPLMQEVAEVADKEIHDAFGDEAEEADAERAE
ncbi:MAG: TRAP transporter small permease subunit [Hyphomicrobiaceae bacterium]|nr:TRAP transporter small permease subunit [Hyphomicrobiaceae bacterium]